MKIKCPFCTFVKNINPTNPNRADEIRKVADFLRYHLQYNCPIHNVGFVEDYLIVD